MDFPSKCILWLSVWLSSWLYQINVKTAKLIWPKFCVGPHITPDLKNSILSLNLENLQIFFMKYKEKTFTIEIEDGREAP